LFRKKKNIWIEQTDTILKIHSDKDMITMDHKDVPILIKALEAYYNRYTAIQLSYLGSLKYIKGEKIMGAINLKEELSYIDVITNYTIEQDSGEIYVKIWFSFKWKKPRYEFEKSIKTGYEEFIGKTEKDVLNQIINFVKNDHKGWEIVLKGEK